MNSLSWTSIRYNNSLLNVIDYFEHVYCNGFADTLYNLTCHPLHTTYYQKTYAIMFTSIYLQYNDDDEDDDARK
jgi:hypothetical protein